MAVTLTSSPSAHAGGPASTGLMAWIVAHRWPVIAALLVLGGALALGIATFRPDWLPSRAGRIAQQAANQIGQQAGEAGRTVASLFDLRSPGERVAGALASLKHKRQPLLHARALPKVRRPLSPLAAIVAGPPVPPVVPPVAQTPLFDIVKPPAPVAITAPPGSPTVVFPGVTPLPGGGGGVIISPPGTTPTPPVIPVVPVVPVTPTTPGVPEPATWLMMMLGFAMIGAAFRRKTELANP